jgi:type I restriction enzyme S subunit
MKNWMSQTLAEVVTLQRGYDLPEHERTPGSVPVLGSFGITGNHNLARAKGPGVTVGRSGASFGVVNYSPIDYWPHNTVLFVTDFHGNDPRFVYYLLRNTDFSHLNSGSAQPSLNRNYVYLEQVKIPLVATQRKIAALLSAYDDLIENNTRRIRILEAMAQALYREWFVQFRFPGHGKVKVVDSPLGPVPQGWRLQRLGDIAEEVRRSVSPDEVDPATPYVGLEHLPRKSIALQEWGTASQVQSTKLAFKKGEILFGKIRPYFHKVAVAPLDGVCSSDTIVICPKSAQHFAIVLASVSSDPFVAHATQTSQGTKMPRANWQVLVKYPIAIPPEPLFSRFSEFIENTAGLIRNVIFRNRVLRRTRDLLLPKLISGEVDVSDLDIDVRLLSAV